MSRKVEPDSIIRFGPFEVHLISQELSKHGKRLRLSGQSFQVLKILLERPGELVTREELQAALWPSDTFVDFEHGLNAAINRLRETLGDNADHPRYIETLPRRGYRFLGSVAEKATFQVELAPQELPSPPPPLHAQARKLTRSLRVLGRVLAGLSIAAAIGFYSFHRRTQIAGQMSDNSAPLTAVPFTTFKGQEVMPTFSPDGSQIAFAWDGGHSDLKNQFDLYVKVAGAEKLSRLTHKPSTWLAPAWSPDGRSIVFARKLGDDSGIFEISSIGGPERRLASVHFSYTLGMSMSWSSDGKLLAYADGNGVMRVLDRDSGRSAALPPPPQCLADWCPRFSPRDSRIAFLCERNSVFLLFLSQSDGTAPRQLDNDDWGPQNLAWSADGKSVLLTDPRTSQLVKVDVKTDKHEVLSFTQDAWNPAVSRDGRRLAFARAIQNVNIWATSLHANNNEQHRLLVSSTRTQQAPDISPDGKRIAFESDRSGVREIWVSDFDGSNALQLTHFNHALTGTPRWSPGGKLIAFDSRHGGRPAVYVVDPEGGMPRRLSLLENDEFIPTWSRDGNSMYVTRQAVEIYKISLDGRSQKLMAKRSLPIGNAKESEDGKSLYFSSDDMDTEIRVVSSSGGEDHAVAGMPKVSNMTDWALGKDEIFFIDRRTLPVTIKMFNLGTKQIRQIVTLNKPPAQWGGLCLSPDGQWLSYSQVDDTPSDIMLVDHFR